MSTIIAGPKSVYLNQFAQRLLERSIILDLFTITELRTVEGTLTPTNTISITGYQAGDILRCGDAIGYVNKDQNTLIFLAKEMPVFNVFDHFVLQAGAIANALNEVTTTVGIFLQNLHVLANPLGSKILYINGVWNPSKIENIISEGLQNDTISVEECKRFINGAYFINSMTDIFVPGVTERGITTDKRIREVREKFIADHKGQMSDPAVATELEQIVIKMHKEFLADDASKLFYDGLGKKAWGVQLKKMFLTGGIIDAFEQGTGNYEFIDNSLSEGWKKENIPILANETRKGSYNRGVETRDGGAQTKFILRAFQDMSIRIDDCQTMHGQLIDFSKLDINEYVGRTLIVQGKRVLLNESNLASFDGKVCEMLGPRTCKSKFGLCYTCCGNKLRKLHVKAAATLASEISSTFLSYSMANMHGTIVEVVPFDFKQYFV